MISRQAFPHPQCPIALRTLLESTPLPVYWHPPAADDDDHIYRPSKQDGVEKNKSPPACSQRFLVDCLWTSWQLKEKEGKQISV
ncbi:hypothetical protein M514_01336 [Trichuris suis]|uniref:Uncharacterized protein n=1 Tax=Trichuris suis TaxID=68888 RepID=A0A085MKC0_9BILA|nr:hypothetical protein M513_01336 [Trichuris suis]KFD72250.1 hypothetical protein M514_01336 [Trichuris suis]